ncbi:MAG: HAD hydrolase-like protein [Patescibacteria group bacterium]|nr:HAD hydrolase-like protein [Patescibacteria group bacterium]
MIILDLDNTIFNTPLLKEDIYYSFKVFGISDELFFTTLKAAYDVDQENKNCYSPKRHAKLLFDTKEKAERAVAKLFQVMEERGHTYLYSDVKETLVENKKNGVKLILLTQGDEFFQKKKIEVSGISDLFDDIIIVQDGKSAMAELLPLEDIRLAVNDRHDELEKMHKLFPRARCVEIQRSGTRATVSKPWPVVSTIADAILYFNKQ